MDSFQYLHHFGSFFELFTAINLGIAGSEVFRHGFANNLLSLNRVLVKRIKAKIDVLSKEIENFKLMNDVQNADFMGTAVGKDSDNFKKMCCFFEDDSVALTRFRSKEPSILDVNKEFSCFKGTFLLSGFFCLYILVLEGFELFYKEGVNFLCCLYFAPFLYIYYLCIFIYSFNEKWRLKDANRLYVALTFFSYVSFSIVYCTFNATFPLNERWVLTHACIIAVAPFVLYVIRDWFQQLVFGLRYIFLWVKFSFLVSLFKNHQKVLLKMISSNVKRDYIHYFQKFYYMKIFTFKIFCFQFIRSDFNLFHRN